MSIERVTVKPGCISCGLCAFIAPELFEVTDVSHVKQGVDPNEHEEKLKQAAAQCPVRVISYTKKEANHDTSQTE